MDESAPVISVIMPTYNTPVRILSAAVDSILSQSFRDFEFLIIDDCSTDESVKYLSSVQDVRVRVIRNEENMGITRSLNVGLAQARGCYIARMDSDDISLPQRFEKQLAYMQAHPEVIVCGAWIQAFGDANYVTRRVIPDREYLRCSFIFGNSFGLSHPTAFFRKSVLDQHKITYDEALPTAQDYGMWTVCAEYGDIANVEEILLNYRVHSGQISVEKRALQIQCASRVQNTLLRRILPELTEGMAQRHTILCRERKPSRELKIWVRQLKQENRYVGAYDADTFDWVADAFVAQKFTDWARVVRTRSQILELLACCPATVRGKITKILFRRMIRTRKSSEGI